jgi:hypothetical protein
MYVLAGQNERRTLKYKSGSGEVAPMPDVRANFAVGVVSSGTSTTASVSTDNMDQGGACWLREVQVCVFLED